MLRRVHKFLSLAPLDRKLFFQTAVFLQTVQIGLAFTSFQKIQHRLLKKTKKESLKGFPSARPSINQIVWAVQTAGRSIPPRKTCLAKSLIIQFYLTRFGYPNVFKIGAAKDEKGLLKAHAWVESEGRPVMEESFCSDYKPFPDLPETS